MPVPRFRVPGATGLSVTSPLPGVSVPFGDDFGPEPVRVQLSTSPSYSWKTVFRPVGQSFDSVSIGNGPTGGADYREAIIRALAPLEPFCDPWLRREDGKIKANPAGCSIAISVEIRNTVGAVAYYWQAPSVPTPPPSPPTLPPILDPSDPTAPVEFERGGRWGVPLAVAGIVGLVWLARR